MIKKNKEVKPKIITKEMTLKPKQKIKRKNKKTQLQTLYEEGKVTSEEFYKELIIFIKWRLMTDLIKRGYYIDGVRQSIFTRDECDACYTHVLRKIINEYSPEKGTLATYIRWQIRGWSQLVIQKQVKEHKYTPQGLLSLDDTNKTTKVKLEEYRNKSKLPEEMESLMDMEYFGDSSLSHLDKRDIEKIREEVELLNTCGDWCQWLG